MLFFCLQGPLLILEGWLRRLGRQAGVAPPRPLRVAATLGLLHAREQAGGGVAAGVAWHWWPPGRFNRFPLFLSCVRSHRSPPLPVPYPLPAVAHRLFFPDLVASGVPARLLRQVWSAAGLGRGPVCGLTPRAA